MTESSTLNVVTNQRSKSKALASLRARLRGLPPLDATIAPWMQKTLEDRELFDWVEAWGSPLNVLSKQRFAENITELRRVGSIHQLDFAVYFARKANKCLEFVEVAADLGAGVDTASFAELRQAIDVGVPSEKLICTAAIKELPLLQLGVDHGVVVAIDNLDELHAMAAVATEKTKPIALRVGGFEHDGRRLTTRFGFDIQTAAAVAQQHLSGGASKLEIRGVQFHLDGYCHHERVSAINQSLDLIDELSAAGHPVEFLDMGGGFPICYLEERTQWEAFWKQHREAMLSGSEPATYRGHTLGYTVDGDRLLGEPNVYPFYQELIGAAWLDTILSCPTATGRTIAEEVISRDLQFRCEPGRALLNGCGMTVAKVIHRKRDAQGDLLVGISMNRTQCRTGSCDFLVDPLLVPSDRSDRNSHAEYGDGYLTGAYCTESEAILLRKLNFSSGIAVGDLIAFPNTAGYFMHFYECRSHQFPLAENRFVE